MKSWLVRFLGIRKKSLHPFISRWGSGRLRFERHSHDLVQVSIPQRPTVPIDVQFVPPWRNTPPVRLVFLPFHQNPTKVEAKKQGKAAFREDLKVDQHVHWKFWWETEKFHRRNLQANSPLLIDDYPIDHRMGSEPC